MFGRKQALWHLDHYEGPWELAVDVGAYHGDFTLAVAERGCEVIAYEANVDNFDVLLAKLAKQPKASAINAAVVGNPNGNWYVQGSGNVARVRQNNGGQSVGAVGLTEILTLFRRIDLVKIDIEGGEHEIFAPKHRAGLERLLRRVRFLQVEIHPPDGFTSDAGEYAGAIEDLVGFFNYCGFRDMPCPVRVMYAGDFCSNNHEFNGGR